MAVQQISLLSRDAPIIKASKDPRFDLEIIPKILKFLSTEEKFNFLEKFFIPELEIKGSDEKRMYQRIFAQTLQQTLPIDAFYLAIEIKSVPFVTAIFDKAEIQSEIKAEFQSNFRQALLIKDQTLLEILLLNKNISQQDRGEAVVIKIRSKALNTLDNGPVESIKILLENGDISQKDRGEAVIVAATNSYTDVIKMLLENGEISQEDRGEAVRGAAVNGYVDVIKMLLENREISQEDRGFATAFAIGNGHLNTLEIRRLEIIKILLKNGEISQEGRGNAVISASRRIDVEAIKILLENGDISQETREEAIQFAFKLNHTEAVSLLLKKPISKLLLIQLIKKALIARNFQMLKELIGKQNLALGLAVSIGIIAYGVNQWINSYKYESS